MPRSELIDEESFSATYLLEDPIYSSVMGLLIYVVKNMNSFAYGRRESSWWEGVKKWLKNLMDKIT